MHLNSCFFCLMIRPPLTSTPFPYTTLFRSFHRGALGIFLGRGIAAVRIVREQKIRVFRSMLAQPALEFCPRVTGAGRQYNEDRKSTRLNSSHGYISYAVFCLKKKNHSECDR